MRSTIGHKNEFQHKTAIGLQGLSSHGITEARLKPLAVNRQNWT